MILSINGKTYLGKGAVEIVREIALDSTNYAGSVRSIRQFSLGQQGNGIPPRDLDLSERLGEEPL